MPPVFSLLLFFPFSLFFRHLLFPHLIPFLFGLLLHPFPILLAPLLSLLPPRVFVLFFFSGIYMGVYIMLAGSRLVYKNAAQFFKARKIRALVRKSIVANVDVVDQKRRDYDKATGWMTFGEQPQLRWWWWWRFGREDGYECIDSLFPSHLS